LHYIPIIIFLYFHPDRGDCLDTNFTVRGMLCVPTFSSKCCLGPRSSAGDGFAHSNNPLCRGRRLKKLRPFESILANMRLYSNKLTE
jgi:hypothetical protein